MKITKLSALAAFIALSLGGSSINSMVLGGLGPPNTSLIFPIIKGFSNALINAKDTPTRHKQKVPGDRNRHGKG